MNRRLSTLMLVVVASAAVSVASQATPEGHVVTGTVQLDDGSWLGIGGSVPESDLRGRAWIGTGLVPAVDIALDCIEVSWHQPVYPLPPYLHYHVVQASGMGTDGTRYFITAYDAVARPAGFGDFAAVARERADGACGADADYAVPIQAGDISVLP